MCYLLHQSTESLSGRINDGSPETSTPVSKKVFFKWPAFLCVRQVNKHPEILLTLSNWSSTWVFNDFFLCETNVVLTFIGSLMWVGIASNSPSCNATCLPFLGTVSTFRLNDFWLPRFQTTCVWHCVERSRNRFLLSVLSQQDANDDSGNLATTFAIQ